MDTSLARVAEFAKFQHEYVFKNIAAADAKAVALIAVASALLGYISQNHQYIDWVKSLPSAWELRDYLAAIASVALVVADAAALKVLWPNLRGAAHGFIYWRSVAQYASRADYAWAILTQDGKVLIEEMLRHCQEVSRVCLGKYRCLRAALWAGLIGVAALFVDFAIVTAGW